MLISNQYYTSEQEWGTIGSDFVSICIFICLGRILVLECARATIAVPVLPNKQHS